MLVLAGPAAAQTGDALSFGRVPLEAWPTPASGVGAWRKRHRNVP